MNKNVVHYNSELVNNMSKLRREFVINKYFKNHTDHKMCVTLNDFTGFEGVLRRIDDSYYLYFEDCFKFTNARKLNINFENGEKLFVGKMKIYCDDVLGVVVKELVPLKKDVEKSIIALKMKYLSLTFVGAFRRANRTSRAIEKAAVWKRQKLVKEERELRKSWSNFFGNVASLNLKSFLRQRVTEELLPASSETHGGSTCSNVRNRLVADFLNTVQKMDDLVQTINKNN